MELEGLVIGLFAAGLLMCILVKFPVLYALLFGFFLFLFYGLKKGYKVKQLLQMSWGTILTVRKILLILLLIGALTAVWRASGTIAFLVYYASKLMIPRYFILLSFLLCCGLSVLTGTSFGTAATIGLICMTMGAAAGVNPVWTGGAVLAGAFFGDRCSPMSTSALLICQITGTNIYGNLRRMIQTAWLPFVLTCAVYLAVGVGTEAGEVSAEAQQIFLNSFRLHWITVLPAAVMIVLSLCRMDVRMIMAVSALLGSVLCVWLQCMSLEDLPALFTFGFRSADPALAVMMDGGGIFSMITPAAIVCLSSSYAGIFEGTGLLDALKGKIHDLSGRITPFGGVVVTAALSNLISCNQTLSIILTQQLCGDLTEDRGQLAIALEDTAVVIAPLIPWSIAGAVPIAAIGAPTDCIFAACYLYLLPVCGFFFARRRWKMGSEGLLEEGNT